MMSKPTPLFLLLLWLSPCCRLPAQTSTPPPPTREFTLRTLATSKGDYEGIYVQAQEDEEPVLLSFNRFRRSGPVAYDGPVPILFFRLEPSASPEEPPRRIPVARYQPPEGLDADELLLLFHPVPDPAPGTPQYTVYGMGDSFDTFPPNHVVVFNATPIPLLARINQQAGRCPPGPTPPLPFSGPLDVMLGIEDEPTPLIAFRNQFNFREDYRALLVILPPKRANSIRIQCFHVTDKPLPPPEETP